MPSLTKQVIRGEVIRYGPPNRFPYNVTGLFPLPLLGLSFRLAWYIVYGLKLNHWYVRIPVLFVVGVGLAYGWRGLAIVGLVVAVVAAGLAAWFLLHRQSWRRFGGEWLKSRWRRAQYRRRWQPAMAACGLMVNYEGMHVVPALHRVDSVGEVDYVTVGLATGQVASDMAEQTERLAAAFGAASCKVTTTEIPYVVRLTLRRTDPLTAIVAPLPVPNPVDLTALPMALTEDGELWTLRLYGTHVLVGGATGSGKGSVLWSLVRALAAGISAGLVNVWAIDPKQGVELAAGRRLFARFVYESAEAIADVLDEAWAVAQARADRMRGVVRQHVPTVGDPLIVILIDELASLTAYLADVKLARRIRATLELLLSQGRALGVHVVAAVQDPRKESVPMRHLFPTRIALRMSEASQADLILDDGARDRGALCDLIPKTSPGVGYVVVETDPTPLRVRFSFLTDSDITELGNQYGWGES